VISDGPPDEPGPGAFSLPLTAPDLPASVVRSLDRIGVGIAGLEVVRPTLDDVFLTFTGRHAEAEESDDIERRAA
jgi:hypothetical protein